MKKSLFAVAPVVLALGCATQPSAQAPTPIAVKKGASVAQVNGRGWFMPTPLDGVRLAAKNVELQLPRGCEALGQSAFVHVAEIVDDEDADFLGACNVVEEGKPRVTIVLLRHRLSLETGESAAAQLRRAPGVIDVVTTTAGPMIGQTMGPEVVLSTNLPTQAGARPSASVYFGAQDGLYVLYAEVDGDLESLAAWGEGDAAGNENTAATPLMVAIDNVLPTVAISAGSDSLIAGQTALITFTLSEPSADFGEDDVVVSGGTLSGFTGEGTTYTAIFTPTADSTVAASIDIAAGRFTDAAGNGNLAAAQTVIAVDTRLPVVTIASTATALKAGETAVITFTFDEAVNDDDTQMSKNGVTLLIDAMSLQYLTGAEIDYKEDLQGAQFVIKNPNATTTCGCGSSFSA